MLPLLIGPPSAIRYGRPWTEDAGPYDVRPGNQDDQPFPPPKLGDLQYHTLNENKMRSSPPLEGERWPLSSCPSLLPSLLRNHRIASHSNFDSAATKEDFSTATKYLVRQFDLCRRAALVAQEENDIAATTPDGSIQTTFKGSTLLGGGRQRRLSTKLVKKRPPDISLCHPWTVPVMKIASNPCYPISIVVTPRTLTLLQEFESGLRPTWSHYRGWDSILMWGLLDESVYWSEDGRELVTTVLQNRVIARWVLNFRNEAEGSSMDPHGDLEAAVGEARKTKVRRGLYLIKEKWEYYGFKGKNKQEESDRTRGGEVMCSFDPLSAAPRYVRDLAMSLSGDKVLTPSLLMNGVEPADSRTVFGDTPGLVGGELYQYAKVQQSKGKFVVSEFCSSSHALPAYRKGMRLDTAKGPLKRASSNKRRHVVADGESAGSPVSRSAIRSPGDRENCDGAIRVFQLGSDLLLKPVEGLSPVAVDTEVDRAIEFQSMNTRGKKRLKQHLLLDVGMERSHRTPSTYFKTEGDCFKDLTFIAGLKQQRRIRLHRPNYHIWVGEDRTAILSQSMIPNVTLLKLVDNTGKVRKLCEIDLSAWGVITDDSVNQLQVTPTTKIWGIGKRFVDRTSNRDKFMGPWNSLPVGTLLVPPAITLACGSVATRVRCPTTSLLRAFDSASIPRDPSEVESQTQDFGTDCEHLGNIWIFEAQRAMIQLDSDDKADAPPDWVFPGIRWAETVLGGNIIIAVTEAYDLLLLHWKLDPMTFHTHGDGRVVATLKNDPRLRKKWHPRPLGQVVGSGIGYVAVQRDPAVNSLAGHEDLRSWVACLHWSGGAFFMLRLGDLIYGGIPEVNIEVGILPHEQADPEFRKRRNSDQRTSININAVTCSMRVGARRRNKISGRSYPVLLCPINTRTGRVTCFKWAPSGRSFLLLTTIDGPLQVFGESGAFRAAWGHFHCNRSPLRIPDSVVTASKRRVYPKKWVQGFSAADWSPAGGSIIAARMCAGHGELAEFPLFYVSSIPVPLFASTPRLWLYVGPVRTREGQLLSCFTAAQLARCQRWTTYFNPSPSTSGDFRFLTQSGGQPLFVAIETLDSRMIPSPTSPTIAEDVILTARPPSYLQSDRVVLCIRSAGGIAWYNRFGTDSEISRPKRTNSSNEMDVSVLQPLGDILWKYMDFAMLEVHTPVPWDRPLYNVSKSANSVRGCQKTKQPRQTQTTVAERLRLEVSPCTIVENSTVTLFIGIQRTMPTIGGLLESHCYLEGIDGKEIPLARSVGGPESPYRPPLAAIGSIDRTVDGGLDSVPVDDYKRLIHLRAMVEKEDNRKMIGGSSAVFGAAQLSAVRVLLTQFTGPDYIGEQGLDVERPWQNNRMCIPVTGPPFFAARDTRLNAKFEVMVIPVECDGGSNRPPLLRIPWACRPLLISANPVAWIPNNSKLTEVGLDMSFTRRDTVTVWVFDEIFHLTGIKIDPAAGTFQVIEVIQLHALGNIVPKSIDFLESPALIVLLLDNGSLTIIKPRSPSSDARDFVHAADMWAVDLPWPGNDHKLAAVFMDDRCQLDSHTRAALRLYLKKISGSAFNGCRPDEVIINDTDVAWTKATPRVGSAVTSSFDEGHHVLSPEKTSELENSSIAHLENKLRKLCGRWKSYSQKLLWADCGLSDDDRVDMDSTLARAALTDAPICGRTLYGVTSFGQIVAVSLSLHLVNETTSKCNDGADSTGKELPFRTLSTMGIEPMNSSESLLVDVGKPSGSSVVLRMRCSNFMEGPSYGVIVGFDAATCTCVIAQSPGEAWRKNQVLNDSEWNTVRPGTAGSSPMVEGLVSDLSPSQTAVKKGAGKIVNSVPNASRGCGLTGYCEDVLTGFYEKEAKELYVNNGGSSPDFGVSSEFQPVLKRYNFQRPLLISYFRQLSRETQDELSAASISDTGICLEYICAAMYSRKRRRVSRREKSKAPLTGWLGPCETPEGPGLAWDTFNWDTVVALLVNAAQTELSVVKKAEDRGRQSNLVYLKRSEFDELKREVGIWNGNHISTRYLRLFPEAVWSRVVSADAQKRRRRWSNVRIGAVSSLPITSGESCEKSMTTTLEENSMSGFGHRDVAGSAGADMADGLFMKDKGDLGWITSLLKHSASSLILGRVLDVLRVAMMDDKHDFWMGLISLARFADTSFGLDLILPLGHFHPVLFLGEMSRRMHSQHYTNSEAFKRDLLLGINVLTSAQECLGPGALRQAYCISMVKGICRSLLTKWSSERLHDLTTLWTFISRIWTHDVKKVRPYLSRAGIGGELSVLMDIPSVHQYSRKNTYANLTRDASDLIFRDALPIVARIVAALLLEFRMSHICQVLTACGIHLDSVVPFMVEELNRDHEIVKLVKRIIEDGLEERKLGVCICDLSFDTFFETAPDSKTLRSLHEVVADHFYSVANKVPVIVVADVLRSMLEDKDGVYVKEMGTKGYGSTPESPYIAQLEERTPVTESPQKESQAKKKSSERQGAQGEARPSAGSSCESQVLPFVMIALKTSCWWGIAALSFDRDREQSIHKGLQAMGLRACWELLKCIKARRRSTDGVCGFCQG